MNHDDDPLIESLEQLGRLKPPAERTAGAMDRVRRQLAATSAAYIPGTRRNDMTKRTMIAVVALALLGTAGLWLIPSTTVVPMAFADVQKKVMETRTVQYVITRKDGDGETQISRVMIYGRYLQRKEHDNGYVSIYDGKTGRMVFFDPKSKVFTILESQVTIYPDGSQSEEKLKPMPQVDLYQAMTRLPKKLKRLPDRKIDGKTVSGFLFEKKDGPDTRKRTFWVDTKTKLPVRVDVTVRGTRTNHVYSDWVYSDFVYNKKLDKSLFSTEPPKGYTVKRDKIRGFSPAPAK